MPRWAQRSLVAAWLQLAMLSAQPEVAATFDHRPWGEVLSEFVDAEGMVDYQALAANRADLDRYLEQIAEVGPKSEPRLFPTPDDRLAYYLNAYNALVFGAVLDLGPEADTVWGFTGTGLKFFVLDKQTLDGERLSLKHLEDELVRAEFQDPRIHAALNCASRGCPRLPREPFQGHILDVQLDAAMTEFVTDERNVYYDAEANTVLLSRIFDWFRSDFADWEAAQLGSAGDLLSYVNRYRPEGDTVPRGARIRFLDYDKRLNSR